MTKLLSAVCLVGLLFCTASLQAAIPPWYVGVNAGVSRLTPETANSGYTLDDSMSFGAGAFLGFDLTRRISAELAFHNLGSAALSNANGETTIGYNALSLSGLLYLYGDTQDIAAREGFGGYLRLGVNSIRNQATIPLDRADNQAIWAGAGVEWPFSRAFSVRAEVATFDGDAQYASLALLYRGGRRSQSSSSAATRPAPSVIAPGAPVAQPPRSDRPAEPVFAPRPLPQPPTPRVENPRPAAPATTRACEVPVAGEPRDGRGCALFTGELFGVDFDFGSARFTATAPRVLDQLVRKLQQHPSIVIEIIGHTEAFTSAAAATEIGRQRTIAVARYLAQRGIPVQRLRARSFGRTQNRADNVTEAGRQLNNRIVLRVLR